MNIQFFSSNGRILPIEQANIPLSNIEYQYGFGVYETLRIRNNILYFVKQHIDRLLKSADIISLDHEFSKEFLIDCHHNLLTQLIKANTKEEKTNFSCNLKTLLIGGKKSSEAYLFILPLSPLFPDRKLYQSGADVITVEYKRDFPNAKTLNMLGSFLAYKKAKEKGCYDALLIDKNQNILEGTRTNFYVVKDTTIYIAPKKKILEGVTMQTVLFVAKDLGFKIEEGDISIREIQEGKYQCAFLTSTNSKIIPLRKIDEYMFSNIPDKVKQLMRAYDEFLDNSQGLFNQ